MSSPEHVFHAVISVALYAGIVPISRKRFSKFYNTCGLLFLGCALVWIVAGFILVSSMLKFGQGGEGNFGLCIAYCYTMVIIIFYIISGTKVAENVQDILTIIEQFSTISIDDKFFEEILYNNANRINLFMKYRFWYTFFLIPVDVVIKILNRMDMIEMKNENNLIHAVNFDANHSIIFWPTFIIQSFALQLVIVIQTFNDLYILNVIILNILAFRYLRFKLGNIVSSNYPKLFKIKASTSLNKKIESKKPNRQSSELGKITVKQWIAAHNSLLRYSKHFLFLYLCGGFHRL